MSTRYLRRYSELTALFYLLSTRKLTLVDPKSWEDGNDQLLSTPGCALRYSILSLTAAHLPDPEIFAALRARTLEPVDRAVGPGKKAVGADSDVDDDFAFADHSAAQSYCLTP